MDANSELTSFIAVAKQRAAALLRKMGEAGCASLTASCVAALAPSQKQLSGACRATAP